MFIYYRMNDVDNLPVSLCGRTGRLTNLDEAFPISDYNNAVWVQFDDNMGEIELVPDSLLKEG